MRPRAVVTRDERDAAAVRVHPAARAGRMGVTAGAVAAATGAALEWIAPLWTQLPEWLRAVASINEPLLAGGIALMIGGAVVARRFRRAAVSHPTEVPGERRA